MNQVSFFAAMLLSLCSFPSIGSAEETTHLRVMGTPKGTFETQFRTTDLNSASVKVRNVGSAEAKNVEVQVIVPSGRSGKLYGPRTLAPNQTAIYSSTAVYLPITKGGKLKAEATCSNCNTRGYKSDSSSERPTTLRAKKPVGVFNTIGGTLYIIDGSIEVKNVGASTANNVKVQLQLPNGQALSLSGPRSIPPYKSRSYRSRLFEVITSTKKLKSIVSCSNCR